MAGVALAVEKEAAGEQEAAKRRRCVEFLPAARQASLRITTPIEDGLDVAQEDNVFEYDLLPHHASNGYNAA